MPDLTEEALEKISVETSMLFMGLEIGGTTLSAGLLDADAAALTGGGRRSTKLSADREPEAVVDVLLTLASEVLAEQDVPWTDVLGIGISCPGQINREEGTVVAASTFPSWDNVPLVEIVQDKTMLPTTILNDASAAATAEFAGRGPMDTIVMLTLGTGIGMGLVSAGFSLSGSRGLIEGGHMIVEPSRDARECKCGQRGCLEAYASGTAVADIFNERRRAAAKSRPKGLGRYSFENIASGSRSVQPNSIQTAMTRNLSSTPSKAAPVFPRGAKKPARGIRRAFSEGPLSTSSAGVKERIRELERRTSLDKENEENEENGVLVAPEEDTPPASVVMFSPCPPSPSSTLASPHEIDLVGPAGVGGVSFDFSAFAKVEEGEGDAGVEDEDVTAKEVFRLAATGDKLAARVVDEACAYLGLACVNICRMLDPDTILLAGGMAQAEGLVEKVQAEFATRGWNILPHECQIETASVCAPGSSGLVGAGGCAAAEYARQVRREMRRSRSSREGSDRRSSGPTGGCGNGGSSDGGSGEQGQGFEPREDSGDVEGDVQANLQGQGVQLQEDSRDVEGDVQESFQGQRAQPHEDFSAVKEDVRKNGKSVGGGWGGIFGRKSAAVVIAVAACVGVAYVRGLGKSRYMMA